MTLSKCETIAPSLYSQSLLLVTTVVKSSVRFSNTWHCLNVKLLHPLFTLNHCCSFCCRYKLLHVLKTMTLSKCETIALSHHSQSLLLVTTVVKSSVRFSKPWHCLNVKLLHPRFTPNPRSLLLVITVDKSLPWHVKLLHFSSLPTLLLVTTVDKSYCTFSKPWHCLNVKLLHPLFTPNHCCSLL